MDVCGTAVVGELHGGQVLVPVVTVQVDEGTQHVLHHPVGSLCLTVRLRGWYAVLIFSCVLSCFPQRLPEQAGEARVAVADDAGRDAVQPDDFSQYQLRRLLCSHRLVGGDEVDHLGELIHHDQDGVVEAPRPGQRAHKVHADGLPGPVRDGQGHKLPGWSLLTGLGGGAGHT